MTPEAAALHRLIASLTMIVDEASEHVAGGVALAYVLGWCVYRVEAATEEQAESVELVAGYVVGQLEEIWRMN